MEKKLPYVVYLNKTYDVWMRDAHKWCTDQGWEEGRDYEAIISETIFYWMREKRKGLGAPFYFVQDILTSHNNFSG